MTRLLHVTTLVATATAITCVSPAAAQDAQTETVSEASKIEAPKTDENGETNRQADAPLDRFGLIKGTQLQVSTGTDDDVLTLGINLPIGPSQSNRFAVVLSTPMHGADGAMPASLDALASGSKATLRWGRFEVAEPNVDVPYGEQIVARALRACMKANADDPDADEFGGPCSASDQFVHRYALRNYRNYLGAILTSGVTDYGIEASVGINDFEWLDPITFSNQKARKTSWGIAGHYTQYLVKSPTAFTFSASYQRAYKAADEELLCPPSATDPATQCKTARGAGPARDENALISAGLRHRFMAPDGTLLGLAIAPLVTYDVIDDVFGVDVPVYLIPGKDGDLTGGIRFGYRSDRDDKFSVSVFFGSTFSLWQK